MLVSSARWLHWFKDLHAQSRMTNSDSDKDLDVDKRCEAPLQLLFQHALLNGLHLIQALHLIQLRQDGYQIGEREGGREGKRERDN